MSQMTSSVGRAHRMPRIRAEADSAAGFLAGLITLLVVLVPAAMCGWYASTMLAGMPAVEVGPDGGTGAVAWLLAAALLCRCPPWPGRWSGGTRPPGRSAGA